MVLVNYINVLFRSYVKKVNLLGNLKIFVICVRVSLFKKYLPPGSPGSPGSKLFLLFFYYCFVINK